jgi:uncharacterized membrane protein YkvA (DUF1232 family)
MYLYKGGVFVMADKKPLIVDKKQSIWKTLPRFQRLLKMRSSKEYTVFPLASTLAIIAFIGYLLVPTDLMPDAIPIIGVLDDTSMLAIVLMLMQLDINKFEEWERDRESLDEEVQDSEGVPIENEKEEK